MATKKENSRLDPLTTLIKLAILPYKPTGTKLSISNNYIHFSENTILQFAIRTYLGDSYNDLRDLRKSLHKAFEWYHTELKMKYLFKNAILGLTKLKQTYGDTGKADAVQSYIDILSGFKSFEQEKQKEKEKENDNTEQMKIHDILKMVWTDDDKEIIARFFSKLNNLEENNYTKTNQTDIINCLESVLLSIHKRIEYEVKILSSI